ncbi:hypothetical protein BH10CHL1_BH10CHL1_50130 [soil metagenome]
MKKILWVLCFSMLISWLLTLSPMGWRAVMAQGTIPQPVLLKEINTNPLIVESSPFTPLGGRFLYVLDDSVHGPELWVSDPVAGTAILLKDINLGAGSVQPFEHVIVGGYLYFVADDGVHGFELWRTDGTPEHTNLVIDLLPGPASAFYQERPLGVFDLLDVQPELTEMQGMLFFIAGGNAGGVVTETLSATGSSSAEVFGVWKTNGTAAGTVPVHVVPNQSTTPTRLVVLNDKLYFTYRSSPTLWRSDGTPQGTRQVTEFFQSPRPPYRQVSSLYNFTAVGDMLFFVAHYVNGHTTELWKVTGEEADLTLINVLPQTNYWLAAANGMLYFSDENFEPTSGEALWKTDGTPEGTLIVKAFPDSSVRPLSSTANSFFFVLSNGDGAELWRSDGTTAGTARVRPYGQWSFVTSTATHLLLINTSAEQGVEVLRTDGKQEDPVIHLDLTAKDASSFSASGGQIYFGATDDQNRRMIWRSDGTPTGTRAIAPVSLDSRTYGSDPHLLTKFQQKIYFVADKDQHGASPWQERAMLWSTDGTVTDMELPNLASQALSTIYAMIPTDNYLLLFGNVDGGPSELWRISAANSTPESLATLEYRGSFTRLGREVYFTAEQADYGVELWKTDGTASGTALVKDINPGGSSSGPRALVTFGKFVCFSADDGSHGRALFRSDGTSAGTELIAELGPDPTESQQVVVAGRWLFFAVNSAEHTPELWRSDGTIVGTTLVQAFAEPATGLSQLTAVGDMLFFILSDAPFSGQLWKTDGTPAGTTRLSDEQMELSLAGQLYAAGPLLYFGADDSQHGYELWRSDGTAVGTHLVRDINPGPANINLHHLFDIGALHYFAAEDAEHGIGLWQTDGTASGTTFVLAIGEGWLGEAVLVGNQLIYAKSDSQYGRELWTIRELFSYSEHVYLPIVGH